MISEKLNDLGYETFRLIKYFGMYLLITFICLAELIFADESFASNSTAAMFTFIVTYVIMIALFTYCWLVFKTKNAFQRAGLILLIIPMFFLKSANFFMIISSLLFGIGFIIEIFRIARNNYEPSYQAVFTIKKKTKKKVKHGVRH